MHILFITARKSQFEGKIESFLTKSTVDFQYCKNHCALEQKVHESDSNFCPFFVTKILIKSAFEFDFNKNVFRFETMDHCEAG